MLAQGFGKVLQIFIPILLYFLTVDRFFIRTVVNFYFQIKHFSKYKFFRTQTYKLKKNIYINIIQYYYKFVFAFLSFSFMIDRFRNEKKSAIRAKLK